MKRLLVLLLLLLFGSATVAYAQSLWGGTQVGMLPDEVRKLFPAAVESTSPSSLANGATKLLEIKDIEIASSPFEARLYFLDGALYSVHLTCAKQFTSYSDGMIIFERLEQALRLKYGKEFKPRTTMLDILTRTSWVHVGAEISLVFHYSSGFSHLNVVYQRRLDAHDAEKL